MDTLIAKYRRPAGMREMSFLEEEEQDVVGAGEPTLSLKFAMPPIAAVSI